MLEGRIRKNTIQSEQFQNHRKQQIPYSQNNSKIIENNKYHTVRTVLKSNRKIVRGDKINTLNTHLHNCSISWLDTNTLIKRGGVKLVLWAQSSPPSKTMQKKF